MKSRSLISALLALALALIPAFAQQNPPAQNQAPAAPQDRVLVTVDGTPILESSVNGTLRRLYGATLRNYPPEQATAMLRQLRGNLVNEMIGKILLVNAAKQGGLSVTEQELDDAMKKVVDENMPGTSIPDFADKAGISLKQFSEDVRTNLLIMKLTDKETAEVAAPTPEEIMKFFEDNKADMRRPESVRARHILIKTEGIDDPAALDKKRAEAEAIRQQLLKDPKLDFAQLAAEKSEGPSGPRGGDLGSFGRGQMVPEFDKAAFSQKAGEIGELVKTKFGYHIIKVEERLEEKEFTLEEIAPQIVAHLKVERRTQRMKELVDELRAAAKIVQPGADKPEKS